jgi:hypothetical protein
VKGRLSRHQKFYLAGYRKGANHAMAEARKFFAEEFRATLKELAQLRADYSALATRHMRAMHANAVSEAVQEREQNPFKPLH